MYGSLAKTGESQVTETFVPFWAKEKGVGLWGFRVEEEIHRR